MVNEKIFRKYASYVILAFSIIAVSGVLGDSHVPYILVIILFWIYILILYFFDNKKGNN